MGFRYNSFMNVAMKNLPEDPLLLRKIILSLETEKEKLTQKTEFLQEQNNLLLARLFSRSSEKQSKSDPRQLQLNLFDEAESLADVDTDDNDEDQTSEESVDVPAHSRKKRGRKPLPDYLPRIEIIHDLPESERICSIDESILVEIGREVTEILDIIPARVRVERHVMIKYGCNHCHKGVKMAPRPLRPIPKALASAAMLAHVATAKYADGLPLYRQGSVLTRAGIDIPRNTLANWMIRAGQIVQPMINLFEDVLLGYDILQADETTVQVLKEDKKAATSKSYMWVRRGGPPDKSVILFDYDPSRGEHVPKTLLAGYKGYLQTDAYVGYLAVDEDPDITLLGCFAHARRYFADVVKALGKSKKGKTGNAGKALGYIRRLYAIEKKLREAKADQATRFKIRNERARPILDELKSWADKVRPTVPPKSTLGKAFGYLSNQWSKLILYLDDGRLEIDNNGVENAIRPFVIGRKGWLFSNSVRGVKASANLYSLIETAKANGLEPFAYLRHLFTELPGAQTADDFEKFLPWNVDRSSREKN